MTANKTQSYEKYKLARVISIYEIVSADYLSAMAHPSQACHSHQDAWELCYCMRGSLEVIQNGKHLPLQAGEMTLTRPGVAHDVHITNQQTDTFIISFTCMDDHIRMLRDCAAPVNGAQSRLFQAIMDELRLAFDFDRDSMRVAHFLPNKNSPLGAEQLICCYLEEIIIGLLREITMRDGKPIRTEHFEAAMQSYLAEQVNAYIRRHLDEELTVSQIAGEFHYSRTRLSVLYKAATGTALGEAVTRERIEKAKAMLLAGGKTVTQISEELGYSSPQYFSRRFTKETGCIPSRYAAGEAGKRGPGRSQ